MMTRKTRLLIVGAIVLVVLLIPLVLFLLLRSSSVQEVSEEEIVPVDQIQPVPSAPVQAPVNEEQDKRSGSAGVTTIAKIFAERYGSYSNEANFQNLLDVLPLMTDSFASRTQEFISSAKAPEVFYCVSSRVITVHVEQMNEEAGTAIILVNTQREVAQGSTQNTSVSYQEIRFMMVKEGGIWKADSVSWL